MSEDELPVRKRLRHGVPHWVADDARFFITVNCAERGREQLTGAPVARALLDSARHYHDAGKWHICLFLLMPDHLHAILSFPREASMEGIFKNWKRYTNRALGIVWQEGYFDHRLRGDEEMSAKFFYIRDNPVKKSLCASQQEWPHQLRWTPEGVVAGAW